MVAESVDILSKMLHQAQIIGSHLDVDISILVLSAFIDLFHLHFFLFPLWNLFSKRKDNKTKQKLSGLNNAGNKGSALGWHHTENTHAVINFFQRKKERS